MPCQKTQRRTDIADAGAPGSIGKPEQHPVQQAVGPLPRIVFDTKLMLYIVIPYLPERMREAAAIALEFDRPQHQSCFGFFVRKSSQRKLPPLRTNLSHCRSYDVSRSSDISSSIRPNASPAAHKIRLRMAKR